MTIRDLTSNYSEFANGASTLSDYLGAYPIFFEHFLKYWGREKSDFMKITNKQLEENLNRVLKSLGVANEHLTQSGLSSSELEVVLFVGQNTTNGHASLLYNRPMVYIALECYSSDIYSRVFCMHELIHGLHYQENPSISFNSIQEKSKISRLLLTEGIATFLTKSILEVSENDALWADYLNPSQLENWNKSFDENFGSILNSCLKHFNSSDPIIASQLFEVSDVEDARTSRAGYKVGTLAIESIVKDKNLSNREVLNIQESELLEALVNLR